jgi:ribosomal protein S27E
MSKELKILKVICSDCGTLNLIPYAFIGDEPIKCEKCGKVLVVRG